MPAIDTVLDVIRLAEAVLHADGDAYLAVLTTTTATPRDLLYAAVAILAAAASDHPDPDAAIRDLRAGFIAQAAP